MKISSLITSSDGRVVIGQWPNWSLGLAIFFFLIQFVPIDITSKISFWGVMICLMYWAYLEITSGVNGFRKALGLVVLTSQLWKLAKFLIS